MGLALVVAALVAGVIFRLVDQRTDAPAMRRCMNAGTERWQALERERRRSAREGNGADGRSPVVDDLWGDGDADDSN